MCRFQVQIITILKDMLGEELGMTFFLISP